MAALRLHPMHACNGLPLQPLNALRPMSATQLAAEAVELAVNFEEKQDCTATIMAPSISFNMEEACIVISEQTDKGGCLLIPIFLAEVAHLHAGAGRHAISLVPCWAGADQLEEAEPKAWLFTVHGDAVTLCEVLDTLTLFGAVHLGLLELLSLPTSLLREGTCRAIYLARSKRTGSPAALKLALDAGSKEDALLKLEARLLAEARGHPNVVCFLGLFRASCAAGGGNIQWALGLQLCQGGDLWAYIESKGPMGEVVAADLMCGPLSGIAHLHKRDIVHCDIKPENILLAENGKPILAGFGVAAFQSQLAGMTTRRGTPGYAAPETFLPPFKIGCLADVFGFGVTIFYVLFATLPFQGQSAYDIFARTVRCKVEAIPELRTVSPSAKAFFLSTLAKHPDLRLSAAEALKHPWFAQCALRDAADSISATLSLPPGLALPSLTSSGTGRGIAEYQAHADIQSPRTSQGFDQAAGGAPEASVSVGQSSDSSRASGAVSKAPDAARRSSLLALGQVRQAATRLWSAVRQLGTRPRAPGRAGAAKLSPSGSVSPLVSFELVRVPGGDGPQRAATSGMLAAPPPPEAPGPRQSRKQ